MSAAHAVGRAARYRNTLNSFPGDVAFPFLPHEKAGRLAATPHSARGTAQHICPSSGRFAGLVLVPAPPPELAVSRSRKSEGCAETRPCTQRVRADACLPWSALPRPVCRAAPDEVTLRGSLERNQHSGTGRGEGGESANGPEHFLPSLDAEGVCRIIVTKSSSGPNSSIRGDTQR